MKCKICSNSDSNITHIAKENMFGMKESFNYVECSKCDCLQISEIPSDLSKYYPSNYYSFNSTQTKGEKGLRGYLIYQRDRFAIFKKGIFGWILNAIWPASPLMKIIGQFNIDEQTSILDVGSGSGSKLLPLAKIGVKISGIDPFIEKKISYDSGLIIEKKTIKEVDAKYNIIMFNHVFEHLEDPLTTLTICHDLLIENGICLLRIPTVSSYAWKHYKTNWVQLDAPRHFFIHSIKSIQYLAEKSGFELKDIIYDSTSFQFIGSELYTKGISFINGDFSEKSNKYFSDEEILNYQKKAIELNKSSLGDQAAFVLVRK